jgi:TIR domain
MSAIFVSYRRDDTAGEAGRFFDDLVQFFGKDAAFMDVTAIKPGYDFRKAIDTQVATCSILLVIIGKNWLVAKTDSGLRRLDDPMDYVRIETASVLKRDIPVIPVLVQGAKMPCVEDLPEDIKELAYRHGVELTHARWDSDVQVLLKVLQASVKKKRLWIGSSRLVTAFSVFLLMFGFGGYWWFKHSYPEKWGRTRDDEKQVLWKSREFPPPKGGRLTFTITPSGEPACATVDGKNCLWGDDIDNINFSNVIPLVCGVDVDAIYGVDWRKDPNNWCNLAKTKKYN